LIIVILSSATIIIINYYTFRILSGARAYINGESQYSKGQKDASASLINYIYIENEADYKSFEKNISVPIGDRIARKALTSGNNYEDAKRGFLQGGNRPEDIDNLIWIFKNFQHLAIFEKAIKIWADADPLIENLQQLGLRSHKEIAGGKISATEKRSLTLLITNTSAQLTTREKAFSDTLGVTSRTINLYAFSANILITLIIVISSVLYSVIMVRNLANSKKRIIEQNESLQLINAGLDKFVFNVTHDLRSPLASLAGLIALIDHETSIEQVRSYTLMMKNSIEKQDRFIKEMLTFIKSKHLGVINEELSLVDIIDDIIAQNHHKSGRKEIEFIKELDLVKITSDTLKLQVILNNLVSNSVKYSDFKKPKQWVIIRTYLLNGCAVIEVEDNGIGIKKADQERIFDKFYMSAANKRSSGIGLYLVKDAVTQLHGKIEVQSEPGLCSKFIVTLPC
jgi:signal transduction histidine kinase